MSDESPDALRHSSSKGTARSQYSHGTGLGQVLTGVQVRDRTSREGHGGRVFVVGWAGPDDPLNPHNWPVAKRIRVTLQISMIAFFVGIASGIDATVLPQAAREFGVSEVAESLATGTDTHAFMPPPAMGN